MDWRHEAGCRHEDPDLFFPAGDASTLAQVEEAKAVCRRCRVIDACLEWAMETRQETGVWGGLSERERRNLRRRAVRTRRVV